MFEIAVSENIRPGEFLMRLNMAYKFNRLLFMLTSLITLINLKAMLVLFSLQAKNKNHSERIIYQESVSANMTN